MSEYIDCIIDFLPITFGIVLMALGIKLFIKFCDGILHFRYLDFEYPLEDDSETIFINYEKKEGDEK